jgi:hypothetical protein
VDGGHVVFLAMGTAVGRTVVTSFILTVYTQDPGKHDRNGRAFYRAQQKDASLDGQPVGIRQGAAAKRLNSDSPV